MVIILNDEKKFKREFSGFNSEYPVFSLVMAIYNTENYINQSIDSVINQTLCFEDNVELILVNDGSTDGSLDILLDYEKQYPNNIIVVSQENAGQASARNNGLNYVSGKFVNFLDSDDYLSINALEKVYGFFEDNYEEIDLIALPLKLFGRQEGEHLLNYKFEKGTRIINLALNPNNPQLHISSTFIKREVINKFKFDSRLISSEDALVVNKILLDKKKYGVIDSACYYYRKRESQDSTLDIVGFQREYFTDRLKYMGVEIISYAQKVDNRVPRFIQYFLAYQLQWLLYKEELPYESNVEIKEFWFYFNHILRYINIPVVKNNRNIKGKLMKDYLYYLKIRKFTTKFESDNIILKVAEKEVDNIQDHNLWLDIVEIKENYLNISGYMNSLFDDNNLSITAEYIKGSSKRKVFYAKYVNYASRNEKIFLGHKWQKKYHFDLKIPMEDENFIVKLKLNYHRDANNENYSPGNVLSFDLDIDFKDLTNLSGVNTYFIKDSKIVYFHNNRFNIIPYSHRKLLQFELESQFKIISNHLPGFMGAFMFRIIYMLLFPFNKNKKIYLFMDRINHADDNAEHLFNYAQNQEDGIEKYYIIDRNSNDFVRLNEHANIVGYKTFKHKLLYSFAEKIISSHPEEKFLNPFYLKDGKTNERDNYANLSTQRYFLQHGVTKGNISSWLHKFDKNLSLILTTSDLESKSFLDEGYNYDKEIIQALGFPRYDNLENSDDKKQVLFIPTWRKYLKDEDAFISSDYYKNLNNVLNNTKLLKMLEEKGYTLIFKGHPKLNEEIDEKGNTLQDLLKINDKVKISNNESYQELFNNSSLLITDYSSVFFDFAYLYKPVIYYQPNDDYHYEEGYFQYEKDAFGEVIINEEDLINKIMYYLNNNCTMEGVYKERVDDFFKYHDKNNCKRVYEWIKEH